MQNLNTIPGVKSTVDYIESHPAEALLLPGNYGDICQINQAGEKLIMSLLFDTVYVRPVVHPVSIRQPICADIQTNYQMVHPPTERSFGYGLWVRKPIPSRLSGEEPVRLLN